jgi:hypothetical protein
MQNYLLHIEPAQHAPNLESKIMTQAKPQFTFWFTDDDRFTSKDRREKTAAQLKAYRADRFWYRLNRVGLHHYEVTSKQSGLRAVIKLI